MQLYFPDQIAQIHFLSKKTYDLHFLTPNSSQIMSYFCFSHSGDEFVVAWDLKGLNNFKMIPTFRLPQNQHRHNCKYISNV